MITKGNCVGRMFTLDVNMPEVKAALFAQGAGVVADVDIWHKRIGHVYEQRLQSMQSKQIVAGLPKFWWMVCIKCVQHASLESNQGAHFHMSVMYVRNHLK